MHEQEAAAGRVGSDCGVVEGHGDDCECFCTPSRFAARREPVPDQAGEQRDQLRSCASHPRAVPELLAIVATHGRGRGRIRHWRDGGTPVLRGRMDAGIACERVQ